MDIKTRLTNKTFILAMIGFVVMVLKTFTKIELPENFDLIVNTALSILVGLGIIIDPTSEGLTDGNKTEENK